jgi:hypothetical protein
MRSRLIAMALAAIAGLVVAGTAAAEVPSGPPAPPPPESFADEIDNPYFPLAPGTTMTYRGSKDGKPTRDVFTVTHDTVVIEGVRCVVVRDQLFSDGVLAETTADWFAQDESGDVWYFGEDTKELDADGHVISTEGTWKAGVDGARPGIIMPARLRVGDVFYQEFYAGHAEDQFRITSLSAPVRVPYGRFNRSLKTTDWTRLQPGVVENKFYVAGVGNVRTVMTEGGTDFSELVSVQRPPDDGNDGEAQASSGA